MNMKAKVLALKDIYDEADEKISLFKEKTHLGCVPGCGDCCNRFEPYISVLEGIMIAQYLVSDVNLVHNFQEKLQNKSTILCPFYQEKSVYHCGVYAIRPFICRLFAFSGKKHSSAVQYFPCARLQEYDREKTERAQHLVSEGLPIPIYREEYPKLCKIDFALATDLHPLTRSIEIALEGLPQENFQRKSKEGELQEENPFTILLRKHLQEENPNFAFDPHKPPRLSA